jgi:exosortase
MDIEQSDSAAPLSQGKWATQGGRHSALKWTLVLLPLAYLWFRLLYNLWPEWTTNPQYGYGLLVPFLCLGLLVRRWHSFTECGVRSAECGGRISNFNFSAFQLFVFALAFLYLPTRLVEAGTPEWRPIQWSLGIEAVGLTLCAICLGQGRGWLRQLAFPICFFFVAIPWPSLVEIPIIQNLTRASAAIVVELLGWGGVPAMAHGNVIEVGTGMVGIDEACSGIRSFQSSLMISLFFGEFYRLSPWRRWLLVPMGFVFSMAFNVGRMSLLTLVAAKKGVAAISEYHDEAGITIAILCTLALWGLALLLRKTKTTDHGLRTTDKGTGTTESAQRTTDYGTTDHRPRSAVSSQLSVVGSPSPAVSGQWSMVGGQWSVVRSLAISLLIWLVLVEAVVQTWYRSRELYLKPGPAWTLTFPRDNPTLKDLPMDAKTRNLLRFDEAKQAAWSESDGTQWEAFYFSWLPGRVAGYLAKRHTPEICLTATGVKLLSGPKLTMMNVHGVELPIRSYVFETEEGVIQVFHCRWEAGVGREAYVEHESARYNLVRAIWAGRGNKGQKVLEFIITGMDDPEQAKQALARQLEKLIKVEGEAGSGEQK